MHSVLKPLSAVMTTVPSPSPQNVPKWMWTLTGDCLPVTLASLCHNWNVAFWKWSCGSIRESGSLCPLRLSLAAAWHTVCRAAVCSRPADEFVPIEVTSESNLLLLVGLIHCKQRGGWRKTGADRWSGLVNALSCGFHLLFLFAQFCSLQLRTRPLYCLSPESELRSFSSQIKNKKIQMRVLYSPKSEQ